MAAPAATSPLRRSPDTGALEAGSPGAIGSLADADVRVGTTVLAGIVVAAEVLGPSRVVSASSQAAETIAPIDSRTEAVFATPLMLTLRTH